MSCDELGKSGGKEAGEELLCAEQGWMCSHISTQPKLRPSSFCRGLSEPNLPTLDTNHCLQGHDSF